MEISLNTVVPLIPISRYLDQAGDIYGLLYELYIGDNFISNPITTDAYGNSSIENHTVGIGPNTQLDMFLDAMKPIYPEAVITAIYQGIDLFGENPINAAPIELLIIGSP